MIGRYIRIRSRDHSQRDLELSLGRSVFERLGELQERINANVMEGWEMGDEIESLE